MKNNNEKKDFSVKMYRVEDDLAPFVEITYVNKDGQEQTGLMVLDSGSCQNVLFGTRAEKLGLVYEKTEETVTICTLGNKHTETSVVNYAFIMGGVEFHEPFCFNENEEHIPSRVGDLPIIGIIGNIFMQQNNLAIDYSDHTLHTSNVSPENLPISDCDFFFPMEIGLKHYGVPVLAIRQNGEDIAVMADTGSSCNTMALPAITEYGFDCQEIGKEELISELNSSVESKEVKLKFNLRTLTEGEPQEVPFENSFLTFPNYPLAYEKKSSEDTDKQPVVGIIGSPFMAAQGWVLDFGVKYIYKRKAAKPVEMIARVPSRMAKGQTSTPVKESKSIHFFADATEKGLPFIRIDEGDFEGLVMLIDTGANDNSIFGFAYRQIEELFEPIEGQRNVYGINGNPIVVNCIRGRFSFCGKEYEMNFLLNEEDSAFIQLSQEMGFPISGIIGSKFLAEHGWMLDFGKQEVVIPTVNIIPKELEKI